MKSENKTQLEKFNAKYAKLQKDQESLIYAELERKQRLLNTLSPYAVDGEKDLMELGNIQEAACVFSYAGIQSFATMFGNSVGGVFRDEIVGMMRDIVRQEVRSATSEMLQGLIKGQYQALQEEIVGLMKNLSGDNLVATVKEVEEKKEQETVAPIVQKTPKKEKATPTKKHSKMDNKRIAEALKSFNGEAIKISDLKELLPDIDFYSNKMSNARSGNPKIISKGYGLYAYNMEE